MADVYGDIGIKWVSLGAAAGVLGDNISPDELDAPGGGRYRLFQHGIVVFHPSAEIGTHALWGLIADAYNSFGGAGSGFFPLTDETPAPGGRGSFADIRAVADGSTWSIYWSPETGAQRIYGAIRAQWLAEGGPTSKRGFPTSDELEWPDHPGGRVQHFEHGDITWLPSAPGTISGGGDVTKPEPPTNPVVIKAWVSSPTDPRIGAATEVAIEFIELHANWSGVPQGKQNQRYDLTAPWPASLVPWPANVRAVSTFSVAQPGDWRFGRVQGGAQDLRLEIRVSWLAADGTRIREDASNLVTGGTTFSVDWKEKTAYEFDVAVSHRQAPDGWQITVKQVKPK